MQALGIIRISLLFVLPILMSSCIGSDIVDDLIEARISILNKTELLLVGDTQQFQATFFDNTGKEQSAVIQWTSSNDQVLTIEQSGLATAVSAGVSTVTSTTNQVSASFSVEVLDPLEVDVDSVRMVQQQMQHGERTATLVTVSSYQLEGTAILREGNGLELALSPDFVTSDVLPGLYIYLTNNPRTIGNALEIGEVTKFSGAQVYEIPGQAQLQQYSYVLFYCKPFGVAVGNGKFEP